VIEGTDHYATEAGDGTNLISYQDVDVNVIEDYCLSSFSSQGAFEDDPRDADKIPWLDEGTGYMYKKYIYT